MSRTLVLFVTLIAFSVSGIAVVSAQSKGGAPVQPDPEPRDISLTIEVMDLRVNADEGRITYVPDGSTRRASYEYYNFDHDAFLEKTGGSIPSEDFEAEVRVFETTFSTRTPSDPRYPSPEGGFDEKNHRSELLSADLPEPEQEQVKGPPMANSGTFEDVELRSGFMPDPHVVEGKAGGPIDARTLNPGACQGQIANLHEPDHIVKLQGGFDYLSMRAVSASPTSLMYLENTQDGKQLRCFDHGEEAEMAMNGTTTLYIYVASPDANSHPTYRLEFTEYRPENR